MNLKIKPLPTFERDLKQLKKKYIHFRNKKYSHKTWALIITIIQVPEIVEECVSETV